MIFKQQIPPEPLNRFIEFYIYYSGYKPGHKFEKLLPDGSIDIIIDLSGKIRNVYNKDCSVTQFTGGWISGIRKEYIIKDSDEDVATIVVHFKPGGVFPFLKFPTNELTNQIINLNCMWGSNFDILHEQLMGSLTITDRFDVLNKFFMKIFNKNLGMADCIEYSTSLIASMPESTTISRLKNQVGFSHKHFIKLFTEKVGVTPKYFARLHRFQKSLQLIEQMRAGDWNSVAFELGFYDQSHFVNEFKHFTGITPTQYLDARGNFINYLPVDR